jgi:hypothetical protein
MCALKYNFEQNFFFLSCFVGFKKSIAVIPSGKCTVATVLTTELRHTHDLSILNEQNVI